jgi:hypothetical protein
MRITRVLAAFLVAPLGVVPIAWLARLVPWFAGQPTAGFLWAAIPFVGLAAVVQFPAAAVALWVRCSYHNVRTMAAIGVVFGLLLPALSAVLMVFQKGTFPEAWKSLVAVAMLGAFGAACGAACAVLFWWVAFWTARSVSQA